MPQEERHRPRTIALAAVIVLHLLLFWLVRGSTALHALRDTPVAALQRVTLRLIAAPPALSPQPQAPRALPGRSEPMRRPTSTPGARHATENPMSAPAAEPTSPASLSAVPAATLSRTEPAASAPEVSLLDSEATRRAIRASARATSLTAEVARVGGEPARMTAQERLGNAMQNAGRGDCVKGEYAGAGMGLLSLPFLVAAAARGACAQ